MTNVIQFPYTGQTEAERKAFEAGFRYAMAIVDQRFQMALENLEVGK